jgi:hypothetical protein
VGRTFGCIAALVLVAASLPTRAAAQAQDIDAGTVLHLRLRQFVSSYGSKPGTRIAATLIAPIEAGGEVRLPLGTRVLGHVERVRRVGFGLSRERASIALSFDTLELPGGSIVPIRALVAELDNARETVDADGVIRGIRATASFSNTFAGLATSVGLVDPMLFSFVLSSTVGGFRIPESEIILPAGTELVARLVEAVAVETVFGPVAPPLASDAEQRQALETFVRALPFRTTTQSAGTPSDVTNLIFLGSGSTVDRAFDAAGWSHTAERNKRSTYAAIRAVLENQGYAEAPMSTLLLHGVPPTFTLAKTLNTFFARHHLRIFPESGSFLGEPVWTSSSTHDSGIAFATRAKSFIHVIDQDIDRERDKVVYDLILTGCVDGLAYVARPWVPEDASNATGDRLITDRRIAVVRLNACASPVRADAEAPLPKPVRATPPLVTRVVRNIDLIVRNDLFRGNIFYQTYAIGRRAIAAIRARGEEHPAGEPRRLSLGGEEFLVVPGASRELAPVDPDERAPAFEPPGRPRTGFASRLAFGIGVGSAGAGGDALSAGYAISATTTLNGPGHWSHEMGYAFSQAQLDASDGPARPVPDLPVRVREVSYSLLAHGRPNGARVRPYVAGGPALQFVTILPSDAFTQRVRSIQPALHYGGGLTIGLTTALRARVDFRESLSRDPRFRLDGRTVSAGGAVRHRRLMAGLSVTF